MLNATQLNSGNKLFLLVTANANEREALQKSSAYTVLENDKRSDFRGDTNFYDIGTFGLYDIVHLDLINQGSVKPDATITAVSYAIEVFHPDAVIIVGVAFGNGDGKNDKMVIGDVIISDSVIDYESGVIRNGVIQSDNSSYSAGRQLVSVMKRFSSGWVHRLKNRNAKVHFGAILSGDKFVDDKGYKNTLFERYPLAYGGEMEGRGAYAACISRYLYEWIIVKGVCDWADGNTDKDKEQNQKIAAQSAVSLLEFVFTKQNAFNKIPVNIERIEVDQKPPQDNRGLLVAQNEYPSRRILKLCSAFIKKNVIKIVKGRGIVDGIFPEDFLLALNDFITSHEHHQRWSALSSLAMMITTTKKPSVQSGQSVVSDAKINFFTKLHERITQSKKYIPLLVKGQTKLGKSTIMSLYFCYALQQFYVGNTNVLCFFVDIEQIGNSFKDIIEYIDGIVGELKRFIIAAKEICESVNKPAIFIIDGLSDSNLFSDPIAKDVKRIFDELQKEIIGGDIVKVVYVIDECPLDNTQKNHFCSHEDIDFLVYLNKVDTKGIYRKEPKVDALLREYASVMMFPQKQFENAQRRLEFFSLPQIDFNFISSFENELFGYGRKVTISQLYENMFNKKLATYKTTALENAHRIINDNQLEYKKYSDVFDIETFTLLTSQDALLHYCAIKHFIDSLLRYKHGDDTSRFDLLFDKTMSVLALADIEEREARSSIAEKIIECFDDVTDRAKSTMLSILSKVIETETKPRIKEFLDNQLIKIQEKSSTSPSNDLPFFVRSLYISRIVANPYVEEYIWEYMDYLFSDDQVCLTNRAFNRFYYEDTQLKGLYRSDAQGKGFDFYCTMHWIGARLENYSISHVRYPLLEIDLFTICNLFQVRTESVYISEEKKVISFLYNRLHVDGVKFYLNKVMNWIDKYLKFESENQTGIEKEKFCEYLAMVKDLFSKFLDHIGSDTTLVLEDVPFPQFSFTSSYLAQILTIFDVKKRGWLLNQYKSNITDDDIRESENVSSLESVGEHIYATYLIGLQYLPEKLPHDTTDSETYDKQKILNAILIHDIGEVKTGDYPPNYVKKNEKKEEEDKFNSKFFLLGTFSSVGNSSDYYDLWRSWTNHNYADINIKIAKDLDRIQMLYKFYQLLQEGKLSEMEEERKEEFRGEDSHVFTAVGKAIMQHVIFENPAFSHVLATN